MKNFFTNVIIAMGLCHLLWLEMVIKTKKADDEEKLKGQSPGSSVRFEKRQRGGMELRW